MAVNQVVMPGFAAYHIGIDQRTPDATALLIEPSVTAEGVQDNDEEEEAGFD